MDIVAVIGARSGSKGLPHKNIRMLAGHPLLAYSIKAAKKSFVINRALVTSDSVEYADIAKAYGAEAIIQPAETAQDESGDLSFMQWVVRWFTIEDRVPDLIVHLRPTTPFRDPGKIDFAINGFLYQAEATALRSVHEMSESAYKCVIFPGGYLQAINGGSFNMDNINGPRQDFPKTYRPNGYVDVLRPSYINSRGRLHGDRVFPFITPRAVEVDTEEDFEFLEYQVAKNPKLVSRLFS